MIITPLKVTGKQRKTWVAIAYDSRHYQNCNGVCTHEATHGIAALYLSMSNTRIIICSMSLAYMPEL